MTGHSFPGYLFLSRRNKRKKGFKKRGGFNNTIFIQSSFRCARTLPLFAF